MALRFFADHCVPQSVIGDLRTSGYEVFVLKNCIPTDSDDPTVIAKAQELDALLVSLNGDFSDIVAYSPSQYGGIIALQVRHQARTIPELVKRLLAYLAAHLDRNHYRGKLLLVEAHRIRIRQ